MFLSSSAKLAMTGVIVRLVKSAVFGRYSESSYKEVHNKHEIGNLNSFRESYTFFKVYCGFFENGESYFEFDF